MRLIKSAMLILIENTNKNNNLDIIINSNWSVIND